MCKRPRSSWQKSLYSRVEWGWLPHAADVHSKVRSPCKPHKTGNFADSVATHPHNFARASSFTTSPNLPAFSLSRNTLLKILPDGDFGISLICDGSESASFQPSTSDTYKFDLSHPLVPDLLLLHILDDLPADLLARLDARLQRNVRLR